MPTTKTDIEQVSNFTTCPESHESNEETVKALKESVDPNRRMKAASSEGGKVIFPFIKIKIII
ncbi:MAG: hypothetical protein LBU13_10890 [Synergistaceae bacterium]|nr:hypothetical protein [Synergistaceae bacterium]